MFGGDGGDGGGEPVSPGGGVLRNRTRRRRESARALSAVAEAEARRRVDTDRSPTTAAPAATLNGHCSRGGSVTNAVTTRRYTFVRAPIK